MKSLFAIVLAVLLVAAFFTWRSLPESASGVPVLYWATDPFPARAEQIRTFRYWLKKNGYPDIDVRVDSVNWSPEKVIIQGVSGVAADLLDHTAAWSLRFRQALGILEDLTDDALRLGFDLSQTWPAVRGDLTVDGRQYAYPTNVSSDALWVNVEEFERVGMEVPPKQWTVEEFERIGKEYVARANANWDGRSRRHFFLPMSDTMLLASTMGGAVYNETQSASVIDSPGFRRALGLRYKWTYVDRLLPSEADRGTFTSAAGGNIGGTDMSLFENGTFAMLRAGRYALVHLRKFTDERREEGFGAMKLAVSEDPYGDFQNSYCYVRGTAIYAGGRHKKDALYFMMYLTSEEYNMNLVRDGDALPPNPKFLKTEEFLRPADRPEEWQHPWGSVHETFANIMAGAIETEFSPFVLEATAGRIFAETGDKYMNNMLTLEESTAAMQRLINEEIQRELEESPSRLPRYRERVETQKRIDALKARGEKVPLSWITNPYWRNYYKLHGLADEAR